MCLAIPGKIVAIDGDDAYIAGIVVYIQPDIEPKVNSPMPFSVAI